MKIGLSSAAYYGQLETDEAAAHIAELPLDTCEVFLETPSEYTTDFTFRMRYNMNNFPVTSVHPLGTQFEPYRQWRPRGYPACGPRQWRCAPCGYQR